MKRNLPVLIFLALPNLVFGQAALNTGNGTLELVRTDQGCGIYIPKSPLGTSFTRTYQWSGRCTNGLVEGFGRITQTLVFRGTPSEAIFSGYQRAGIAIGHSIMESKSADFQTKAWSYAFADRSVSSLSIGRAPVPDTVIRVAEAALASPNISLPEVARDFAAPKATANASFLNFWTYSVVGLSQTVTVDYKSCGSLKGKLAFCDQNPNSQAFTVSLRRSVPGGSDMEAARAAILAAEVFACPNPTTFDGCHALFFQKAQPIIDEIMDFVRSTKPLVENEIAATPK